MKRSRLLVVVMLLLILSLIVFEISRMETSGGPKTVEGGSAQPGQASAATRGEQRRSRTLSDRTNQGDDRYRAHTLNLGEDETLFLSASEFYPEENAVINIHPRITEVEDGSVSINLTPKIFAGPLEVFQSMKLGELLEGDATDVISDERQQQLWMRALSMAKGVDVLTWPSVIIEPGVEFSANMGPLNLKIDGILRRGSDGKLSLKLGELYTGPEEE